MKITLVTLLSLFFTLIITHNIQAEENIILPSCTKSGSNEEDNIIYKVCVCSNKMAIKQEWSHKEICILKSIEKKNHVKMCNLEKQDIKNIFYPFYEKWVSLQLSCMKKITGNEMNVYQMFPHFKKDDVSKLFPNLTKNIEK